MISTEHRKRVGSTRWTPHFFCGPSLTAAGTLQPQPRRSPFLCPRLTATSTETLILATSQLERASTATSMVFQTNARKTVTATESPMIATLPPVPCQIATATESQIVVISHRDCCKIAIRARPPTSARFQQVIWPTAT